MPHAQLTQKKKYHESGARAHLVPGLGLGTDCRIP